MRTCSFVSDGSITRIYKYQSERPSLPLGRR
jgi:hypothetical protein